VERLLSRSDREPARASVAVAAASAFGLCEWLRAAVADGARGRDGALALLLVLAAYAAFGAGLALLGAAARALGGRVARLPRIESVGLAPAALLFLAAWDRLGAVPLSLLAAASLGGAAYLLLDRLARRFPRLAAPFAVWTAHGWLFLLCVAVVTTAAAGGALAVAAILLAAALALMIEASRRSRSARRGRGVALAGAHLLLLAACLPALRRPPLAPDVPPDRSLPAVLLITIDTLRADHVGCYGHAGARTPNIDRLAEQGILFRQAVTHSPWTGPSHASILTGLLPQSHGARVNRSPVPPGVRTLADDLRAAGYLTGGFVSGWPLRERGFGLRSRFHDYDDDLRALPWLPLPADRITLPRYVGRALSRAGIAVSPLVRRLPRLATLERDAASVTGAASRWLRRTAGSPFFVWVHYYDPHLPYVPPDAFLAPEARDYRGPATGDWYALEPGTKTEIVTDEASLRHMLSLYDAEIAFVDREVGRLLDEARRAAPLAGLLTVLTSDHGEGFGEHDLFFFRDLYDPTLRVPLIVVPHPGEPLSPREVEAQVRLVDLAPTILDLLGIRIGRDLDGASLADLMRGRAVDGPGPAFSVQHAEHRQLSRQGYAVRHGGWKLIHREPGWKGFYWEYGSEEIYDLASDPHERRNLIAQRPGLLASLRQLLRPFADDDFPVRLDLTPEQIEKLRTLGYVQ
jgi:arylsulfatase A-like enzyme